MDTAAPVSYRHSAWTPPGRVQATLGLPVSVGQANDATTAVYHDVMILVRGLGAEGTPVSSFPVPACYTPPMPGECPACAVVGTAAGEQVAAAVGTCPGTLGPTGAVLALGSVG